MKQKSATKKKIAPKARKTARKPPARRTVAGKVVSKATPRTTRAHSASKDHHPWPLGLYIAVGLLAIVGFAGGSVYSSFQHDMKGARDRLASIPSHVYSSQYGEIEYYVVGSGPTVLIAHGVTGGIDLGILLAENFIGEGYRFLFVSRFGYLKSWLPANASARLQAAAYRDLLDHLGMDKVFVFGNSAGGPSAMWFAIDYPERVRGLILHSAAAPGPLVGIPPRLLFENDFLYWAAVKVAPDMLIGILLPQDLRATLSAQEKKSLIKNVFLAALPVSWRTRGIIFDNEISTPSVNNIPLEQVRVPTLILQAIDDPREKKGGMQLSERIAGSEYVGLTGGHFLLRQETKIKAKIAEFTSAH